MFGQSTIKHTAIILFIIGFPILCLSQQTLNETIIHDGIQREYILYIPENYTGNTAAPLIINFHGFSMSADQQMWYGDFRSISDTAGFLVVHPQGTLLNGVTHWNVGGWTIGSTTDDVGFTNALIDSLAALYNIDETRIYATGMSNGGYMSFLLACQLSERFAAIASVTGSMTPETYNNCNPLHPTPILQMHGTSDNIVPYNGTFWSKSIDDVIQYWVDFNSCNTTPSITNLPDLDPDDGSTVEHIVYAGGDNGVAVEHYKVIGGGHTWPGNLIGGEGTNYDIDASVEIWNFFSKYDINGLMNITDIRTLGKEPFSVYIYPNPTDTFINIDLEFSEPLEYELFSPLGEKMINGVFSSHHQQIDLSDLSPNIYLLKINNNSFKIIKN